MPLKSRLVVALLLWAGWEGMGWAQPRLFPIPLPAQGQSVQHRLPEEGARVYAVPADGDSLLRVVVWEQGADLALRLISPTGEELAAVEYPGRRPGALILDAVLEAPGEHRLELAAAGEGFTSQRYRLRVEAFRPATSTERAGTGERREAGGLLGRALELANEDREGSTLEALEALRGALAIWRRSGFTSAEAWTLHCIGALSEQLGRSEKALQAYQEALTVWGSIGERLGEAATLFARNDLLVFQGAGEEARQALEQSLATWRQEGDNIRTAEALNDLGVATRDQDPQAGERRFAEALSLHEQEGDRYGQAVVLFNLGVTEWNRGRARRALSYYTRARERLGNDPQERLRLSLLISEGVAYRRLGRLQGALDRYAEARGLADRLGDRYWQALLAHNLATVQHHLGNWSEALDSYDRALELWQKLGYGALEGMTLASMGWLELNRGHPTEALSRFDHALERLRALQQRSLPYEAVTLHGRGVVATALGFHDQALADLENALELRRQLGLRAELAVTLSEIGRVHLELGEREPARQALEEARRLSAATGDEVAEAVTEARLGRLERQEGALGEARIHLRAALDIFEGQRREVINPELRSAVLAFRRRYYEQYTSLLLELAARDPQGPYLGEALEASERARARSLLELLTEARLDIGGDVPADLKERESELEDRISEVQGYLIRSAKQTEGDGFDPADHQARLRGLRQEREQLEVEIRRASPRYAEIAYPEPLTAQQIQGLLDPDTALVEYMLGDEVAVGFVVTRERLASFVVEASSDEIEGLVEQLRSRIAGRDTLSEYEYRQLAAKLYDLLLRPAEPLISDRTGLMLAPDASLYYLPFEALLTERVGVVWPADEPLPYLLERHRVVYIPSATVLASLDELEKAPLGAAKRWVAFADPQYQQAPPATQPVRSAAAYRGLEAPSTAPFPQLPWTRDEVTRIASLFPRDTFRLFLGAEARETTFKHDPVVRSAQILHLAAHGVLDEDQPANSGLVLNLWSDDGEDGLLQLDEIFQLRLNADLAVLSACSTALGRRVAGEGLVGLSRAFLYAGVPSLVVSLWQVEDDRSTAELMVAFYRALEAGASKSEALRKAKLDLARRPEYRHPYHWTPFILVGRE